MCETQNDIPYSKINTDKSFCYILTLILVHEVQVQCVILFHTQKDSLKIYANIAVTYLNLSQSTQQVIQFQRAKIEAEETETVPLFYINR